MRIPRIGLVTRREMKGYLFMLPWIIGCVFFFLRPLAVSFWYSLNKVTLGATGIQMEYVGLINYLFPFQQDADFALQMYTFFPQVAMQMTVILVLSLVIAMMLIKPLKAKGIFRTLFFLPIVAISGPVLDRLIGTGTMNIPMIESYGMVGLITGVLPESISKPIISLFSELIKVLWFSGVPILIYMTGLQKIDHSRYEAALIDGADGWISFWKITLPAMQPFILINGIYSLVFLATNATSQPLNTIMQRMTVFDYGTVSTEIWSYAIIQMLILVLFFLLVRPRKTKAVEIIKTREEIRIERLYAQSAAKMNGGKKHGQH